MTSGVVKSAGPVARVYDDHDQRSDTRVQSCLSPLRELEMCLDDDVADRIAIP
jgi:hypothetical protein